jgi:hypothetical protein
MDNNEILIYTMPTFKFKKTVKELFDNTFSLDSKLNNSIKTLQDTVNKVPYKLIVGIAYQPRNKSYFYKKTINKFHRNKTVIKGAPGGYNLYIPQDSREWGFKSKSPRKYPSFCNLVFYKLKHFIKLQKLKTLSSYVHIQKRKELISLKNLLINDLR